VHDSTIFASSLAADIAVPVFMLLCAPIVFSRRSSAGPAQDSRVAVG